MQDIKSLLKQRYGRDGREIILLGADLVSQKGYTLIPNFVLHTDKLSAHAKLVYSMLLSYAWGSKNAAFPGQKRLAEDCGVSARTVMRATSELEHREFMTVLRRGQGRTNVYLLHFKRR